MMKLHLTVSVLGLIIKQCAIRYLINFQNIRIHSITLSTAHYLPRISPVHLGLADKVRHRPTYSNVELCIKDITNFGKAENVKCNIFDETWRNKKSAHRFLFIKSFEVRT